MPASSQTALLVLDDDQELREQLARNLERAGYRVHLAASVHQALELLTQHDIAVAIVDHFMPDATGMDFLSGLVCQEHDCAVIMMSGKGTVPLAVEAMKQGAVDFLMKPVRLQDLLKVIERQIHTRCVASENAHLKELLKRQTNQSTLIGHSEPMLHVERLIQRMGPTDKPVLILGESGTGKELAAREIVRYSPLKDKPLVTINCAALTEPLLESELFGHEKGSFTGATATKPGLFEVADGGTLFIDEIGELSQTLQPKLLRVLEDGSLRRIGSIKERHVHVRLIAATNRQLDLDVKAGKFREDLFYRINMLTLSLPPLRDRGSDIELLVRHFLGDGWRIEPQALEGLLLYDWPGNVRQLRNALERAKILADDNLIEWRNFPEEIITSSQSPRRPGSDDTLELDHMTRSHLTEALQRAAKNKTKAAQLLGVTRRSLYRLLEKHGISF